MALPTRYVPRDFTNGSGNAINDAYLDNVESELFASCLERDAICDIDAEYTGSDNTRWVDAWNDQKASSAKYVLRLPARTLSVSSTVDLASGCLLMASNGVQGVKNLELSSGNYVPGKINFSGTGAMFNMPASSTANDVNIFNLAVQMTNGGRVLHSNSNSNIYPYQFHSWTVYGGTGVLGSRTLGKFLGTQGLMTGHWTVLGYTDTPFHDGGSDKYFNWYLNSNSPNGTSGGGKPIFWADGLQKTRFDYCYLTAERDWTAFLSTGDRTKDVRLIGSILEGRGSGTYPQSTYPLIDCQGGVVIADNCRFAHVSDDNLTNAPGVIELSGDGIVVADNPVWENDASTADTFPFLYQADGATGAYKVDFPIATNGAAIRIRNANGTTYSYPLESMVNGRAAVPPVVTGSRIGTAALADLLGELAGKGYVTDSTTASPSAVTGSRSSNAALASLLTQLAAAGIITDSTT